MTQSERAKVGQALDDLRDALADYVDVAMSAALGERWNEAVADRETERFGRQVRAGAKNDLAVLLKAIVYQKVAPWWGKTGADPSHRRISGFAGEILSLRNLYAHGDACIDEYERLVDTCRRLLGLLVLPVPVAFRPAQDVPSNPQSVALHFGNPITVDDLELELARLGEEGKALDALMTRATLIGAEYARWSKDLFSRNPASVGGEIAQADKDMMMEIGATASGVIEGSYELERNLRESSVICEVLTLWARCLMVHLYPALLTYVIGTLPEEPELPETRGISQEARRKQRAEFAVESDLFHSKMKELRTNRQLFDRWMTEMGTNGSDGWRMLSEAASRLDDSSHFAHQITMMAKFEQATAPSMDSGAALNLIQEAINSARFLAASEPGSMYETVLVNFLRRQGAMMNDVDRPEDAVRAFARADEIIDRYPSADPHLTA